jgi:hypothetical protein
MKMVGPSPAWNIYHSNQCIAGDNIDSVPIFVTNNTAVKVANTAYILASFHNTLNSLTAIQQGLKVTVVNGTVLKAGTREPLLLNTGTEGVALAGAMLYAQEGAKRVGSFTDTGKKFVKFPGCGKNQNGKYVGVIQEDIVSEDATYSMLSFNVPTCVPSGNITMAGLSVTDKGFGVWKYTFLVTGSKCSSEESTNHHFSLVNDRKGEEDRN